MASDNEDDDLAALREAALASIKQKVQPIENVFSGSNFARSQDTSAWSDVPASIDFPGFSDPIPEQNHFPTPFVEAVHQPPLPQHLFRPAAPWNPLHQNRMPPFQRLRHPRFPQRTFGDMSGLMQDRVNRRIRPRGGRGGHPHHHLTNITLPSQTSNMAGANLIVIQPHMHQGDENVSSLNVPNVDPKSGINKVVTVHNERKSLPESDNTRSTSKLILPQDKYHSSTNSTSTQGPDKDPEPKTKSKDKFSRYEKSDSEEDDDDDDLSEVDNIANEIDKVLQEDFLAEEIVVKEAEETETAEEKSESVITEVEEKKDSVEDRASSSTTSPDRQDDDNDKEDNGPKSVSAAMSDISDSESLDLDALAGGEPVVGDLEDLDSLVDKEPDIVMGTVDSKDFIDRDDRKGSIHSKDIDRNNESQDNCIDGKKDSEMYGNGSRENRILSERRSPLPRRSSLSPKNHRNSSSPRRYPNPVSPKRNYDSYSNRAYPSPRRSRSPLYNRHSTYRPVSPRSTFRPRSRSPYRHRSPPIRRSISPRRKMGSPNSRRYESSPRRYPADRVRRRSLSPVRRARSPPPRENYRPNREEGSRIRDGVRPNEHRYRDSDRSHRDRERPRQAERERLENQKEPDSKAKDVVNNKSPLNQRVSPPVEKKAILQEKVSIDLEKLPPEERAKIEARRKKFDSGVEVNVTEVSTKKISLKDIKKREKKAKKKEDEEKAEKAETVENLNLEESLPDNVNKKSSKSGISLKKLRKKQESKKKKDEEVEEESPKVVGVADLVEESEDDSDGDRSWRKESSGVSGPGIRFGVSRTMVNKAPLVSLDHISREGGRRHQDLNRRQHNKHERRSRPERSQRIQSNRWSSDDDSDNGSIQASRLSSSVVTSKSKHFQADVPPEKLRIQVQIASKDSKKKSKAIPDFSNVYSVHAKRHRSADVSNIHSEEKEEVEEEVVPVKKMKKKKEKKKKHSKDERSKSSVELMDEMEPHDYDSPSKSPAKPSVLERLGKKVSLDSFEKKEKKKKKSKKNRDIDEDTDDLDLHILKMKAKNEEILRRQREIELDKERYG